MEAELSKILADYSAFEFAVKRQIADICAPHCSTCESACCRPEYCRESTDSPFLSLICFKSRPVKDFCTEYGWLTPAGCALSAGRPPVCYQFNCDRITDALPDDLHRYLTRVLSNLVSHIGKRALGNRHLVEIMDPARLNKIKHARFAQRLGEARKALQIIRTIDRHDILKTSSRAALSKIVPPPDHLPDSRTKR